MVATQFIQEISYCVVLRFFLWFTVFPEKVNEVLLASPLK